MLWLNQVNDHFRNVDEILYHARVHPERRCNTLSEEEIDALYQKTVYVCTTAVSVNADDSKFPDDWLFKHRWVSYDPWLIHCTFSEFPSHQGQGKESKAFFEVGT